MPTVQIDSELEPLIPKYLAAREADVSALRLAVKSGDWVHAARIGHRMKGTGEAYGFAEITRLGQSLHDACKAHDGVEAQRLTEALATYLRELDVVYS